MLIFPAIDLMDGSAVRLSQGKRESAKTYSKEPWEIAKGWAKLGIPRLHVVDLDAAFARAANTPKPGANNRTVIRKIVEQSGLEVEVGGGVRTLEDCEALFDVGVKHVVLGTAAVKDPAMVREACARWPKRIVVAVDAREGKVSVEGWTEDTSADAVEVGLAVARAGAGAVLYTDIGRDGMRTGPNLDATKRLAHRLAPCPVIASGGVSKLADLDALLDTGAFAVVIGKALYEGVFTVEDALQRVRDKAI
ncbi:MAG TPA: 1-(5-phosphoribosyl)-5-[(5-phosphoribosylamino)methylideneamino]imidazole-4-carboxamide isomerase [Polyangia bacterium]|jgi:phosphoribosylformimino-5-aminoimidazole carboxamide ribotide isomerase|nr:1-(5-phosphoribosyl)-5-[(5-phosphoribosylamino)methylideneamino]imidazole-4-carboxamide isomerase [Polyangia bacterium]